MRELLKYDRFSTQQLVTIWKEAHVAAYGKPAPWKGQARETVIQELNNCLFLTTLKDRVAR